jgi:hypothetical protein
LSYALHYVILRTLYDGATAVGVSPVVLVVAAVGGLLVIGLGSVVFGSTGRGSHAGHESPRRAYRREMARQMAREDARKIQRGEKPRRRWMQW